MYLSQYFKPIIIIIIIMKIWSLFYLLITIRFLKSFYEEIDLVVKPCLFDNHIMCENDASIVNKIEITAFNFNVSKS